MRRPALLVLAFLLVASYGYRAYHGLDSGMAFARAKLNEGSRWRALDLWRRSAVGFNRLEGLRRTAEAELSLWDRDVRQQGIEKASPIPLVRAAEIYVDCLCEAPTSRRPWEGLAEVYHRLEWTRRTVTGDIERPRDQQGWSTIGRWGRVSIGLSELALERAPNWASLFDQLALRLWRYGLEDEALEAVRASARVSPIFGRHRFLQSDDLPESVLVAFLEAARESLGQAELTSRSHLIELGRLEWRLGKNKTAEETFRQALEAPGTELREAEAHYLLGLVLLDRGRYLKARAEFEIAAGHEAFRIPALRSLAAVGEDAGELDEALTRLRALRREQPENLDFALSFARIAGKLERWDEAQQAVDWARLAHPGSPLPYRAQIQMHLGRGNLAEAVDLVEELATWAEGPEFDAMRQLVVQAGGELEELPPPDSP